MLRVGYGYGTTGRVKYGHTCKLIIRQLVINQLITLTCRYHTLNGSSSPVLTATSLSYGKAKNSTPHRIKTPDLIETKFGTVDYVGEMNPHAKFHVNPSKGGFPANR